MLEAQKIIEGVEAEAAQYVPRAMIAQLRSRSYHVEDPSSVDGRYFIAVSDIIRTSGWCEYILLS